MPAGVTLGAGVVLGTVGPNIAELSAFVEAVEEADVPALALSAARRERDMRATIPARASAAATKTTSIFFGCADGGGSTGVACVSLFR